MIWSRNPARGQYTPKIGYKLINPARAQYTPKIGYKLKNPGRGQYTPKVGYKLKVIHEEDGGQDHGSAKAL